MAGAFSDGSAALVVNLGSGDVAVAEKILYLADVHAGIEEQGGGRSPKGVRDIDIHAADGAIRNGRLSDGVGQTLQVALHEAVEGGRVHETNGQLLAPGIESRSKQGAAGQFRLLYVLPNGLSRLEVQANGPALVALLVQPDGGLVAILVKVRHLEPARRGQPGAAVEEELQNRPIPVIEQAVSSRQAHELPGAGGRQGSRLLASVGGLAANKLGMGWVWHGNG